MRLIDADALLADFEKRYCTPCKADGKDYHEVVCRACWVDDMRIEVEDAHAIDAVPVVRCRDCGSFDEPETNCFWCYEHDREVELNGFCSYGERRTNGE